MIDIDIRKSYFWLTLIEKWTWNWFRIDQPLFSINTSPENHYPISLKSFKIIVQNIVQYGCTSFICLVEEEKRNWIHCNIDRLDLMILADETFVSGPIDVSQIIIANNCNCCIGSQKKLFSFTKWNWFGIKTGTKKKRLNQILSKFRDNFKEIV